MVEEHGADMSARDKKDARRVQADFEFEEVGAGARRGRRDRGDREREREPPPTGPPRPNAAGARRREAFSGSLTANGSAPATPAGPSRQSPSPPTDDPAAAERQTAILARVSSIAPNPNTAVPAVKAAIRSYRANESAARDLISTMWNISDRNMEGTAGVINAIVDFLEDEEKKKDLLQAWNGFKIEQRNQFPELVPSGIGSEWAGITGGRLLNAKQSTASRSASQSSGQVLDRVARAAASSTGAGPSRPRPANAANAFPPLQASASTGAHAGGFRQTQHKTPWSASAAGASTPPVVRAPVSVPGPGARTKSGPANLSRSAFPELPMSAASRVPKGAIKGNQSLRNVLGESLPASPAWGGSGKNSAEGSGTTTPAAAPVEGPADAPSGSGNAKGKKGKGKQKQTLFTLGSFPT
ncbi:hypothetical protein EIP86_004305 [Pleurotus ostreatoroseus]|nr:hypothetical protein EIP86_004305 [Pleurotus ostreatoroseus]